MTDENKPEPQKEIDYAATATAIARSHYRALGKLLKGRRRLPAPEQRAIEFARTLLAARILDEDGEQ